LAQAIAAFSVANRVKVDSAKLSREGVTIERDRIKNLAANWSQMSEDDREEAFAKRLAEIIPSCIKSCPRRTYAYIDGLIAELAGSPIADVCANIRVGLEEARRNHMSAGN
jgi:hypothetical protein